MILKNGSFIRFADEIKSADRRIVIFGAGMIGTVTAPEILRDHGIAERIDCYIDNDRSKDGTVEPRTQIPVFSPDRLSTIDPRKTVLLIAVSRFSDVLRQLESIEGLRNITCYLLPMMCAANFKPAAQDETRREHSDPQIPKVIHYMWLGKSKLPESIQYCVDTWKRLCPDYEIVCWNEDNFDVGMDAYMKQAYDNRMYSFVSDSARLYIIHEHGGIYMDTDVELIRSPDPMLYQSGFCCVEKWQTIALGAGFGAVKGNKMIRELIDMRKTLEFISADGELNKNTCGYYDTSVFLRHGFKMTGKPQKILDMNVYPSEYFLPYNFSSGQTELTEHTYSVHHYSGTWMDDKMQEANRKTAEEFERLLKTADNEE